MNIDTTDNNLVLAFSSVDNTQAHVSPTHAWAPSGNQYIGCIVSADRSKVFWTNTSKPLPTT